MDANDLSEDEFARHILEDKHLIAINTEACKEHKNSHANCEGCISELGCTKYMSIRLIQMHPMLYTPNSYVDYASMITQIARKTKAIVDAKTIKEVLEIF